MLFLQETIFFSYYHLQCIKKFNNLLQEPLLPVSKSSISLLRILFLYFSGVVMASGIIGIVFMFIHNLISERFLLIFNPIFLMYLLILIIKFIWLYDDCS